MKKKLMKSKRLGKPTTKDQLLKMLRGYPGDTDFGFRNQPRQTLYALEYPDGYSAIVFQ